MSVACEGEDAGQEEQPRRRDPAATLRPTRPAALLCLATTVAIAVAAHLVVIFRTPIVRTLGDEASYTREAHRHIDDGPAQLLPGRMLFHHRPPFAFHFFALFAERDLITHPEEAFWIIDTPHESWSPAMARFVRSLSLAHLALLIGTGIGVYALCARLGGGAIGANVAAALVLLNPRVGFFVQSVWSEILHMSLLVASLLLLVCALQRRRPFPDAARLLLLAAAGVTMAYAALTRGVLGGFVWFAAAFVAGEALLRARDARVRAAPAVGRAAVQAALLLLAFHGTLLPQRLANLERHGTPVIAHNTWRNIEGGVARTPDYMERYKAVSDDPEEREALSRRRVLEHLRHAPKLPLLVRQTRTFLARVSKTYVERGFERGRWGRGVALSGAAPAAALASWLVLGLGLLGLVLRGGSSAGALLVAGFTIYYMAGLMVVIPNARLFVQLVVPLAVFAGLAVDALATRLRPSRTAPSGSTTGARTTP